MIRTLAGVAKPKVQPAPPPVYRPQASATPRSPAPAFGRAQAVQAKTMTSAPPVYRPQSAPTPANAAAPRIGATSPRTASSIDQGRMRAPAARTPLPVSAHGQKAVQRFRLAQPLDSFGAPQAPSLTVATRGAVVAATIDSSLAPIRGGPSDPDIGGEHAERHFHCLYCAQKRFSVPRQLHPQELTAIDHIDPSSNFLKGNVYASPRNPRLNFDHVSGVVDAGRLEIDEHADEEMRRLYRQIIYNDLDNLHIVCAGHNQSKGGQVDFHHHQLSGGLTFHVVDDKTAQSGKSSDYKRLHQTSHKTTPLLLQGASSSVPQLPAPIPQFAQHGGSGFPSHPPAPYGGYLPTPQHQPQSGGFHPQALVPYPHGGYVAPPQLQQQTGGGFPAYPPPSYGGPLPTPSFQQQSGGFPAPSTASYSNSGGGYPPPQPYPYSSGGYAPPPQQQQPNSFSNPSFFPWVNK
jgi:hypothetical protein